MLVIMASLIFWLILWFVCMFAAYKLLAAIIGYCPKTPELHDIKTSPRHRILVAILAGVIGLFADLYIFQWAFVPVGIGLFVIQICFLSILGVVFQKHPSSVVYWVVYVSTLLLSGWYMIWESPLFIVLHIIVLFACNLWLLVRMAGLDTHIWKQCVSGIAYMHLF